MRVAVVDRDQISSPLHSLNVPPLHWCVTQPIITGLHGASTDFGGGDRNRGAETGINIRTGTGTVNGSSAIQLVRWMKWFLPHVDSSDQKKPTKLLLHGSLQ